MEQFISYLYEYENGRKIRNVGFTKVRKHDQNCSVQIYGKGLDFGSDKQLQVFVFYVDNGHCIGVVQGVIEGAAPIINYLLKFDESDTDGAENFSRINGVILQNENGKRYAAVWNDENVDIENMRTGNVQEEQPMREQEPKQPVEEIPRQEQAGEELRNEVQKETESPVIRESLIEHVERLVEEQQMTEKEEEVDTYQPPSTKTCEKIRRQDISRLPRRDWGLANNSFLLHGFYNYHHLLYIKEGDMCWLGVPGIYHEKERAIARSFGFPQFQRIEDMDVNLSDDEKNLYDDFGYWCRQVELR